MICLTPVVYWWWFHRLWLESDWIILVLRWWHLQYMRKHKEIKRIRPGWWKESIWVPLPGCFFSWEGWCLALAGHKVSDSSLAQSKFSSSKSSHSFPRSKHTVGICVDDTAPQWVFETKVDIFEGGKPFAPIWLISGWWIWLPPSLNPGFIPTKEHEHRFEKGHTNGKNFRSKMRKSWIVQE